MSGPWLHIDHIGREVRRPEDPYWLDLRRRLRPAGGFIQAVLAGALAVQWRGDRIPAPAGSALLLHTGMNASYGLPPGAAASARFEWVFIGGAGAEDMFADLVGRLGPVLPDRDGSILGELRVLAESAAPGRRGDPIVAAEAVHAFLARLARRAADGGPATTVARLRADPLRRWDLAALAREAGCTRDHLGRVFRAATGTPLATWLHERRLAAAERLLAGTRMSSSDIAQQTGFGSAQALARAVRLRHGTGPRGFRGR